MRPPQLSHKNGRNKTLSERLTRRLASARLTWRSSCSSRPSPPAARRSGTPAAGTWWSQSRGPWGLGWLEHRNSRTHVLFRRAPTQEMFLRLGGWGSRGHFSSSEFRHPSALFNDMLWIWILLISRNVNYRTGSCLMTVEGIKVPL